MRSVIQRVKSARVEVDGKIVSSIGPGLLCLIGIAGTDTEKDAEYICRKILNCRVWPNPEQQKAWDQSVQQLDYEVLLVSQFTLYGRLNGNKMDFSRAMKPNEASKFYGDFVQRVQQAYVPERVKDGIFGAMMNVVLENDGPVTLTIESNSS